ncbi:hypothetical protein U0070_016496, partial [Myodes glareolus]
AEIVPPVTESYRSSKLTQTYFKQTSLTPFGIMVKISWNLEIVLDRRRAAREKERFWEKTHKLFLLYIFRMIYLEDGSGHVVFSQCVTHCSFPRWWHQAFYNFFTFGCLFIFPLLIMLVCNAKIIFTLTRLNQSKNNIPRARLRTLKMTVAFATSFIVCWTPYYVLGIWYWFDPEMLNR